MTTTPLRLLSPTELDAIEARGLSEAQREKLTDLREMAKSAAYGPLMVRAQWALDIIDTLLTDRTDLPKLLAVARWAGELEKALRKIVTAFEGSSEFENWECDYGPALGDCPESNNCIPCTVERERKILATLTPASEEKP